jgi:uncharacterized glyoxalase superfamily protein PhnB
VAATGGAVRLAGFEPIFTVTEGRRAVDHYQRLGFTTSYHDQTYAFTHRDNLTIHLALADSSVPAGSGALYLHVDDADQLADDWRKAGLQVVGPEDFDYGKREGWHADPDGNKIRFGSPLLRPLPESARPESARPESALPESALPVSALPE